MPPFNGRQLQQQLRAFLVFIQLQIMMYLLFLRQSQQPPPAPPPPPARQRPKRRHNMWVRPWLLQREERGAYHNIMAELYATDIPGFTNYMRMTPEFFEMTKSRLEPCIARQAINYRAPISVGEKLALTIRYLATGESYTSLSCQFKLGRSTISKFLPEICRAIQDEFTREYPKCPTTPDEWKELESEFRIRWNVPHALVAFDGKHMALKKPKNSGALYHNYKGFFFIVILALVDGQYKFRWVDAGTAGSCSDAQIFNACQLKRRIEDGRIGFPDPAPITQGDVTYFLLADDAFALKTWVMKPYGRRMLTREERIANYRISRGRRVVENAFGILVSRFRVMLTTIELPQETVRDVVMTCVVLHNILRNQYQGQHGGQEPGDDEDVSGDCRLIGGAAGGGPDRNPASEAKRQRDFLRDHFNNEGAVAWQDGRIKLMLQKPVLFRTENQSFSGLPNIPKNN